MKGGDLANGPWMYRKHSSDQRRAAPRPVNNIIHGYRNKIGQSSNRTLREQPEKPVDDAHVRAESLRLLPRVEFQEG